MHWDEQLVDARDAAYRDALRYEERGIQAGCAHRFDQN